MATIRIAETVRPTKSFERTDSIGIGSGIYNIRTNSVERRGTFGRRNSFDTRSVRTGDDQAEDQDSGLREAGDYKTKQVPSPQYFSY